MLRVSVSRTGERTWDLFILFLSLYCWANAASYLKYAKFFKLSRVVSEPTIFYIIFFYFTGKQQAAAHHYKCTNFFKFSQAGKGHQHLISFSLTFFTLLVRHISSTLQMYMVFFPRYCCHFFNLLNIFLNRFKEFRTVFMFS